VPGTRLEHAGSLELHLVRMMAVVHLVVQSRLLCGATRRLLAVLLLPMAKAHVLLQKGRLRRHRHLLLALSLGERLSLAGLVRHLRRRILHAL